MIMELSVLSKMMFLFDIKPKLDECYICLDEIDLTNGAIFLYTPLKI